MFGLDRRSFVGLGIAAAGTMAAPRFLMAQEATNTVRWVSPRGTIEVLDDYPYWVAQKFGWFGDIQTTLEPGPLEATATIKLVDQDQADVGFPSPGVFSLGLEQGIPLKSVFHMGAYDTFSFAFVKGKKPADIKELAGKKILVGSIGWKAIVDPMLAQVGVDPTSVEYLEAGPIWGQALQQGQGDTSLCWEGLRAQWFGQGMDYDYILPYDFSKFPANTFVIRTSDFEDQAKKALYENYFRAWAMGLEFGHLNPRATTQIVLEQFPALASTLTPEIATESMMQLGKIFRGPWEQRQGWGWHDMAQWQGYFDTIYQIKQITTEMKAEDACKNDYIAAANQFDQAAVQKAADEFQLSEDYSKVDVAAIEARL